MNTGKEKYGKAGNVSGNSKEQARNKQDQDNPKNIRKNPNNISNPDVSDGVC